MSPITYNTLGPKIRKSIYVEMLYMDLCRTSGLDVVMGDRTDLIGALLSEAAGLLEDAANLTPSRSDQGLLSVSIV